MTRVLGERLGHRCSPGVLPAIFRSSIDDPGWRNAEIWTTSIKVTAWNVSTPPMYTQNLEDLLKVKFD